MPERKSSQDPNKLAASIVQQATKESDEADEIRAVLDSAIAEGKDPAAVLLGRRGGQKGGPARAKKLSKKRRSEIAKKAAEARWRKNNQP